MYKTQNKSYRKRTQTNKQKKKKKTTTENSKDPVHRGCPIFRDKNTPQGTEKQCYFDMRTCGAFNPFYTNDS